MFLNKDVFAEKNIELPSADWDKDKFLEIAQALTYEKDGEKVYGTVAPTDYFTVTAWLYNNNASVLNEDMTKCTLIHRRQLKRSNFCMILFINTGLRLLPQRDWILQICL